MRNMWVALLLCVASLLAVAGVAQAQEPVTFGETTVVNNFPDSLTFSTTVTSSGADIVAAQLIYGVQRNLASESRTRATLDVTPGRTVDLTYLLDTDGQTVAPSTPYLTKWRVTDADGTVWESAETLIRYHDTRFDWDVLENGQIAVWSHDRDPSFGPQLFDIATEAIRRQRALFGQELAFPITIIVYNNMDEFAAWQSVREEWIGGQAFAPMGITTQIVGDVVSDRWLENVVPHEISHLYYYQVANNPAAPSPHWLNEGVAQYNEFHEHDSALRRVREAARDGDLLLLRALENGFGGSDERIRFSYDVAVSAVLYIVEAYGEAGMARMLQAYKDGLVGDEVYQAAFGRTADQFQRNWIEWLGVSPDLYPTPTPIPQPTFPPTPTPMVFATRTPERVDDDNGGADNSAAAANPDPTATPTPVAVAVVPAVVPTEGPTEGPTPTAPVVSSGGEAGFGLSCAAPALLAPLVLLGAGLSPLLKRRRRQ